VAITAHSAAPIPNLAEYVQVRVANARSAARGPLCPAPAPASSAQVTYVGAANLPAAAYQVTNQLRIPMTAALSRALLKKRISRLQISAVCLLMLGVILVLLKPDHAGADAALCCSLPSEPNSLTTQDASRVCSRRPPQ